MSRCSGDRKAIVGIVLAVGVVTATACKFDKITIPPTEPQVVVHGVLNPAFQQQLVLVERTLTGAVPIADSVFNPVDPITSDGGIPVSNAFVEILDSLGNSVVGREDSSGADNHGTGVYRLNFSDVIHRGARYRLHVVTPQGEELTAEARVPGGPPGASGALTRSFNRDHDTLNIAWTAAPSARAYGVRVESPFGPYYLFTDSTRIRFPGDARNLFANELERLFIPGFSQQVSVYAVDSNFYDYYRTNNDPFTGAGIISRIQGGLGLFGAIAPIIDGALGVTADQTEPIEGHFQLVPGTNDPTVVTALDLYVESRSTRSDVPDALSGRFTTGGGLGLYNGLLGEQTGTHVALVLIANQLAHDTIDVFEGDLDGTTLTGTYRYTGETATFRKR